MNVLLWLHIIAAASWFGAGVASLAGDRVFANGAPETRATWYRMVLFLGQRVFTPSAVVVLITGVLLVTGNTAYGFGSAFVSIGFVAVIVGAALGMAVYGPSSRSAIAAFESGDVAAAETPISKIRTAGRAELVVLGITIAAMVWRLGA